MVEVAGSLVDGRGSDALGNAVDKVTLLAHQQIDRRKAAGVDAAHHSVVGGDGIPKAKGRFSHNQTISLVMRNTVSVSDVSR